MQNTPRRRSITSPGYSATTGTPRKSSVPSLPYLPHRQQQQYNSQRRRSSQHQQPHPDSLKAISESDKPTLELATYASDEFVEAMRQAAAKKFAIVPSRQQPPHLRRMSEPAAVALGFGGGSRESRRNSVDSLVEGPSVAFLSKKTYFGSSDSGQLSSFNELDEDNQLGGRGGESELERAATASEAALTARTLFSRCSTERRGLDDSSAASTPVPPQSSSVRSQQRQQMRRVSIDSAVHMH